MTGGGGGGEKSDRGSYFIPPQIPASQFVYQKNPYFFAYPKKSHTSSKLRLCYCWFELMKDTVPKKSLYFFATQKKSHVFLSPKKIHFGQNFRPQKFLRTSTPSLKYVSGLPGFSLCTVLEVLAMPLNFFVVFQGLENPWVLVENNNAESTIVLLLPWWPFACTQEVKARSLKSKYLVLVQDTLDKTPLNSLNLVPESVRIMKV